MFAAGWVPQGWALALIPAPGGGHPTEKWEDVRLCAGVIHPAAGISKTRTVLWWLSPLEPRPAGPGGQVMPWAHSGKLGNIRANASVGLTLGRAVR